MVSSQLLFPILRLASADPITVIFRCIICVLISNIIYKSWILDCGPYRSSFTSSINALQRWAFQQYDIRTHWGESDFKSTARGTTDLPTFSYTYPDHFLHLSTSFHLHTIPIILLAVSFVIFFLQTCAFMFVGGLHGLRSYAYCGVSIEVMFQEEMDFSSWRVHNLTFSLQQSLQLIRR